MATTSSRRSNSHTRERVELKNLLNDSSSTTRKTKKQVPKTTSSADNHNTDEAGLKRYSEMVDTKAREDNFPLRTGRLHEVKNEWREKREFCDDYSINWSTSDLDESVHTRSVQSTRGHSDEQRDDEETIPISCAKAQVLQKKIDERDYLVNGQHQSDFESTEHAILQMKKNIMAEIQEEVERDDVETLPTPNDRALVSQEKKDEREDFVDEHQSDFECTEHAILQMKKNIMAEIQEEVERDDVETLLTTCDRALVSQEKKDEREDFVNGQYQSDFESTEHAVLQMKKNIMAEIQEEVERNDEKTSSTSVLQDKIDQQKDLVIEQEKCDDEPTDLQMKRNIMVEIEEVQRENESSLEGSKENSQTSETNGDCKPTKRTDNYTLHSLGDFPVRKHIDDIRHYDGDEGSIQSGAISVTARTKNTRSFQHAYTRPSIANASPPAFNNALANDTSEESVNSSVLTGDLQAEGGVALCSLYQRDSGSKTKAIVELKSMEEPDILDAFFENVESRVCKNDKHAISEDQKRIRQVLSPALHHLEKCDPLFEELESAACLEDKMKHSADTTCYNSNDNILKTPVAFAAELTDGCFEHEDNTEERDCIGSNKEVSSEIRKLKEKWFATRVKWELQKSLMANSVKEKTQKTANYVQSLVGECNCNSDVPLSVTQVATGDDKFLVDKCVTTSGSFSCSGDEGNVLSMKSPSEHSVIDSIRGFRSSILSPSARTSHSLMSKDSSGMTCNLPSDNVVRSPECVSPASETSFASGTTFSEFAEDSNRSKGNYGLNSRRLAVISEESNQNDSGKDYLDTSTRQKEKVTSNGISGRREIETTQLQKSVSPSTPSMTRWAYPSPEKFSFHSDQLLKKFNNTIKSVYSVSEMILDGKACASVSINVTDSNSFEDDCVKTFDQPKRNVKGSNSMYDEEVRKNMQQQRCDIRNTYYNESYDSDLSGFETARYTFDSEPTDERPPMLRLQRSRHDSRSCTSDSNGDSQDKTCIQNKLMSEHPPGYTLADAIRRAARDADTAKTLGVKEPRGNTSGKDPSAHVRYVSSSHIKSSKPRKDPEASQNTLIRSPRSNETEDTSRLTEFSSSSISSSEDQNGEPDTRVMKASTKTVQNMTSAQDNRIVSEPSVRSLSTTMCTNYDDKATVFSGNTIDSFKDCYQDAIPSLPTISTLHTLEGKTSTSPPSTQNSMPDSQLYPAAAAATVNTGTVTAQTMLKSMALLSVSAAVIGATQQKEESGVMLKQSLLEKQYSIKSGGSSSEEGECGIQNDDQNEDQVDEIINETDVGKWYATSIERFDNGIEHKDGPRNGSTHSISGPTPHIEEITYSESISIVEKPSDEYRADIEARLSVSSKETVKGLERCQRNSNNEFLASSYEAVAIEVCQHEIRRGDSKEQNNTMVHEEFSLFPSHHRITTETLPITLSETEIVENLAEAEKHLLNRKKCTEVVKSKSADTGPSANLLERKIAKQGNKLSSMKHLVEGSEDDHSNLGTPNEVLDNYHLRGEDLEFTSHHDDQSSDNFTAELATFEQIIKGYDRNLRLSSLESDERYESDDLSLFEDENELPSPKSQSNPKQNNSKKMCSSQEHDGRLSVDDRRRRRLRQRRKFEKVLLGDDDSSSMSSSTTSMKHDFAGDSRIQQRQQSRNYTPLISASFDSIPVIKE